MTAAAGRLPNFFIIGAQKSGTTSLHHYLRRHPQIYLPEAKEPHYFAAADVYARGQGWYESLFGGAGDAIAVGEASTTYSMEPHYDGVPGRLLAAVPEPKLIYLMRHPIERMRSAYHHALGSGFDGRPIDEALRADNRYLDTSRYRHQLDQWRDGVPRDRILLLTAEQLRTDRRSTLRQVLRFLAVDDTWAPSDLETEFHDSTAKRAPRRYWRAFGDVIIRRHLVDRVPARVLALNARQSALVTRPIAAAELMISDSLRAELVDRLRPDLAGLRALMPADFDAWGLE